jgi:hypothetical protein
MITNDHEKLRKASSVVDDNGGASIRPDQGLHKLRTKAPELSTPLRSTMINEMSFTLGNRSRPIWGSRAMSSCLSAATAMIVLSRMPGRALSDFRPQV